MGSDNSDVARIQFLIPTLNDVDMIDDTIQSIYNQDYDMENIFIHVMDFGSTDGTFEKLQEYPSYHMGIYRDRSTKNRRLMLGRMAEILLRVRPGGHYCFSVVLYPGDIAYPEFSRECSEAYIGNKRFKPAFLICEADIMDEKGNKISQTPLFDEDCVINGYTQMIDYVGRAYRHQVQCIKEMLWYWQYREIGEYNESRWWNKCARRALEELIVYVKEPLLLERQIFYEDELEEILLRWESLICQVRIYESKFGHTFDDEFVLKGSKNLAEYAIWRSFLLFDKDMKASEDCLLISGVIDPEIKDTELYRNMENLLKADGLDGGLDAVNIRRELEEYFKNHGGK